MRILVALVLAACGDPGTAAGPDSAMPPGGDGPPPPPPPSKTALVELRLQPPLFDGESPRLEVSGGFLVARDPRCQVSTVGDCEVANCPQALIGNTYAAPGKLTFSPALGGAIAFTPGASFLSFSADVVPWAANEAITLSASGADVPAFTASVASPRTLDAGEGRSPVGPPLVRSQPFAASWVPIAERVEVVLRQGRDTPNGPFEIRVSCSADGASGGTSVPAAALASFLPKASGGLTVFATAHAKRETVVNSGDFAVTYRVLRSFDEEFSSDVQ